MKKLGIALSSGGARGFAHIGILQEFEKNNIHPDYVTGTSMGAIIGALYCSGHSAFEIEKLVKSKEWKTALKIAFPKAGLVKGDEIRNFLKKVLKKNFKELNTRFTCIATNVDTGKKVVLNKGDLSKAVYASMAVPGIFTPLIYKNMVLVDGGLVEPVPTKQLKEEGIDFIIGVNLTIKGEDESLSSGESFGFGKDFLRHLRTTWLQEQNKGYRRILYKSKILESRGFFYRAYEKTLARIIRRKKENKRQVKNPNLLDILTKTMYIMSNQIAVEQIKSKNHNLTIEPKLSSISLVDEKSINETIEAGRKAARKIIPKLKEFKRQKPCHQE